MDKIPSVGLVELVKYVGVFIAILNSLIAYIFTNFKKSVEKRVEVLETRVNTDHDILNNIHTEHKMNHIKNNE